MGYLNHTHVQVFVNGVSRIQYMLSIKYRDIEVVIYYTCLITNNFQHGGRPVLIKVSTSVYYTCVMRHHNVNVQTKMTILHILLVSPCSQTGYIHCIFLEV